CSLVLFQEERSPHRQSSVHLRLPCSLGSKTPRQNGSLPPCSLHMTWEVLLCFAFPLHLWTQLHCTKHTGSRAEGPSQTSGMVMRTYSVYNGEGKLWQCNRVSGGTTLQRRAEYVRREIIRLCHAGLDSHTLRVETIKQLRKVIPIDVSFFATADPATLLF